MQYVLPIPCWQSSTHPMLAIFYPPHAGSTHPMLVIFYLSHAGSTHPMHCSTHPMLAMFYPSHAGYVLSPDASYAHSMLVLPTP